MSGLFDFVGDINYGKKNLLRLDPSLISDYKPFMVNRALSFSADTILYANEMNKNPELSKQMQYDFYIQSIRKAKRYNKWIKQAKDKDLEAIQEYFECSYQKAVNILKLLSDADLKEIKQLLNKGGKK